MFFQVNSQNRLAVRKLLTSTGLDSTAVRVMRTGELGSALYAAVKAGTITADAARAACSTLGEAHAETDSEAPAETVTESVKAAIASNGHAPPPDAGEALVALLKALSPTPAMTETAIAAMAKRIVREELLAAGQRPAVIEIRIDGNKVGELKGKQAHTALPDVCTALSTRIAGRRQHVWLVGPSGSGKSYLAGQAAEALGLKYYSTSAIHSKYDLIGFVSPTGAEVTLRTPFRNAFETGGVFAWDDIDASDPRAFVAFNEALSNGRFAFPDGMVNQHEDFVCVASANTWGTGATADYVGRNKIDAATLSRFVRIEVNYDESLERDLVGEAHITWARFVQNVREAVRKEGIKVLITPRHTLQGAALLHAGMARDKVESMTVFAGLDTDTVKRLRAAA